MKQMEMAKQQPPPLQDVKMNIKDLADGEQAQILQRMGIQADVRHRALRSGAKIQEKQQEQETQKIDNLTKIMGMINESDAQKEMDTDAER